MRIAMRKTMIRTVGIISEYNPFHSGHAYHIRKAKELSGADYAVVIMNGDFVQRGEPAIFDKYTRTKKALEGGADLVLELPLRFGISSAGDFALGGVLALDSLGFVTDICFGSECGDIRLLTDTATVLANETEGFRTTLAEAVKQGLPYPAARAHALKNTLYSEGSASIDESVLSQPNNILGVEYCLALQKLNSSIHPITIKRKGQGYHDTAQTEQPDEAVYPSATALRQNIYRSEQPHLCLDDFSDMLRYSLLTEENLTACKDITPDIADRIKKFLPTFRTATEFTEQCQTRAFTAGRIRRCLLQCLFRLKETAPVMPYLRLLGAKKEAGSLLRQTGSCQILSRLSTDLNKLDDFSRRLFEQDILASDLYRQTYCRKYNTTLPNEYQHSPIIL